MQGAAHELHLAEPERHLLHLNRHINKDMEMKTLKSWISSKGFAQLDRVQEIAYNRQSPDESYYFLRSERYVERRKRRKIVQKDDFWWRKTL